MVVMTEENTEVRRARRSWPARYKLDVLEEIDQAKLTGEPGAVGEGRQAGSCCPRVSTWDCRALR